jgi:hypothetical protein
MVTNSQKLRSQCPTYRPLNLALDCLENGVGLSTVSRKLKLTIGAIFATIGGVHYQYLSSALWQVYSAKLETLCSTVPS